MKNILIVDDHTLIFSGLKSFIERSPALYACCHAQNSSEAEELIQKQTFYSAIVDITIRNENGFSIAEKIRGFAPQTWIFFLSMHKTALYIQKAYTDNYAGYFLKERANELLLKALENPEKKRFWADDDILHIAHDSHLTVERSLEHKYNQLTTREQEVFLLLAQGLNYKEIAFELKVSAKTASAHRYNIFQKLYLKDQTELLRFAISIGLIAPEDWQ